MAPMHWSRLLSRKRLDTQMSKQDDGIRSAYHRDYDRIVFSPSFRRLGRKTQVHPLAANDHIHTRLTHSLEVGCVGRSLGLAVGDWLNSQQRLPDNISSHDIGTIVQSACLAHDIGNPPFGHAGEYAIRAWFKSHQALLDNSLSDTQRSDLMLFEGNAQGFRILTQIESHLFDGGLRLTCATLGSLLKYPWLSSHPKAAKKGKFNIFAAEQQRFLDLSEELGLIELGQHHFCRHPLSYLMEAADDICYKILDLEDALEMGLVTFAEVEPIFKDLAGQRQSDIHDPGAAVSHRRRIIPYRAAAINNLINQAKDIFIQHYNDLMNGQFEGDLLQQLPSESQEANGITEANALTRARVFSDQRKIEIEVGSYSSLSIILEALISAVNERLTSPNDLSFRSQRILSLMGTNQPDAGSDHYHGYMCVADFVSGMTDNYATYLAGQIGGRAI